MNAKVFVDTNVLVYAYDRSFVGLYHCHLQLPLCRVDCFTHRCPVLQFEGESYRFRAPRKS